MAPLVPDILSPEFNFVIAFLVGIGFGFALEQAGFSSTRKLVGLFYGYDFTVLKVFFTAGVTAMTGVLLFGHLGILDLSILYINPTFIWPALIGGVIMGLGFILGGFCPGTSLCAFAVGRIDAFAFVGGSILGIFAFTEGYPLIEELYMAGSIGAPTMDEMLGISPELFGILLTIIAVVAFFFTSKIEDAVNHTKTVVPKSRQIKYGVTALVPLLVILVVWITPNKQQRTFNRVEQAVQAQTISFDSMTIDKLAFELMNHHHEYNLIDVRDTAAYNKATIPSAINVPLTDLYNREWRSMLRQRYKTNIYIGANSEQVYRAAALARELGDTHPIILERSVSQFRDVIFNPVEPVGDVSKTDRIRYEFHIKASEKLKQIEERLKNSKQPPKKEIKQIQGGCA